MNTVVGFANDRSAAIFVSAGTKRGIIRYLKSKIPSGYAPLFFSALVFLLLKNEKFGLVLIDEEYTGKDEYISETIKGFFKNDRKKYPDIIFGRIGKRSRAHALAIKIHRTKGRGATKIGLKEIMSLFSKKEAGSRRRTHRVSR